MPTVNNRATLAWLLREVRAGFALDWDGIHGAAHWARVRHHGVLLAGRTGASARVAELFAFVHDSQRLDDGYDPLHGPRAAGFVRELGAARLGLSEEEHALLQVACHGHSDGLREADITVQVCWDADRLDLGRVGITPDPARMCTAVARDHGIIAAALRWSQPAWQ